MVEAASGSRSNSSLIARDLCGYVYDTWVDVQVVESGTWWNSWNFASNCQVCSSSSSCSIDASWSSSTSASFSSNFDTSTEGTVLSIINGDSGLNLGYTWATGNSQSGNSDCSGGSSESIGVWTQQEMGWSNSQTRTCWSQYEDCIETSGCGAWSAYMHGDWPLAGESTINVGCSVGSACYACNIC
ncbi:hypothetical protein HK405_013439 [Cladochytrium tenue]|nr:hypothetical protein HK405_013439 [Cladochytrium tenue]